MLRFKRVNPENFPSLILDDVIAKEVPNSKLKSRRMIKKAQSSNLTARNLSKEPLIDQVTALQLDIKVGTVAVTSKHKQQEHTSRNFNFSPPGQDNS